jgi:hypothetical protein
MATLGARASTLFGRCATLTDSGVASEWGSRQAESELFDGYSAPAGRRLTGVKSARWRFGPAE